MTARPGAWKGRDPGPWCHCKVPRRGRSGERADDRSRAWAEVRPPAENHGSYRSWRRPRSQLPALPAPPDETRPSRPDQQSSNSDPVLGSDSRTIRELSTCCFNHRRGDLSQLIGPSHTLPFAWLCDLRHGVGPCWAWFPFHQSGVGGSGLSLMGEGGHAVERGTHACPQSPSQTPRTDRPEGPPTTQHGENASTMQPPSRLLLALDAH